MKITIAKTCVIYCRVSSKEQEETGYSLDAQEKLLIEYAQKQGIKIAKTYRITESASGKQIRKTFNEMFQFIQKNGVNIILCEKIDRLTRNLKDASTVSEWIQTDEKKEVHFIKENFVVNKNTRAHENLVWDMKVAIARFYTNNLSEEVRKGQKEKLAQGWLPTKPPLGYKTTGEKGHKIHIIDQSVAPFIKKAFEMYASGNYSMEALRQAIYVEGFRTRAGKKPAKSVIENMLNEPFYYGAMIWKDTLYIDAKHEPIITKELFDKAQRVRSGKIAPAYSKHSFQFKKMMKCGECGGTITAELQKGIVYYHCGHYKACTQKPYTPEKKIEEQLFGVFKFFENITPQEAEAIKAKIKENHAQETEYKETTLRSLNSRYTQLQSRLDILYNDRLDQKISTEAWEKKQSEINSEQAEIQEQISRIKNVETQYFEIWLNILDLAHRAREIYEKRSPEERRLLLSHIFSNLMLKDEKVLPVLTKPIEILAGRVQEKIDAQNKFELPKTVATKRQKGSNEPLCPELLRG